MCGGAILSDIIPPPRRVTGGHLWQTGKKKRSLGDAAVARRRRVPEEEFEEEGDEEFEADFQGFEEAEIWSDDEAKPFAAAARVNGVAAGMPFLLGHRLGIRGTAC
jgi:EREBP-like factor